ncbi:unnamed protein product [Soboliphyme baturini]|uniref:Eukaryotic initiation factor 4E n=1 Tax=Soboliphyme baturini TaxID=241478 RepID=A0A183IVK8_9BILA|nr:unnamed protein product [Soboliphyme baturini]
MMATVEKKLAITQSSPCCVHAEEASRSLPLAEDKNNSCDYGDEACGRQQPKGQLTDRWTFWHFKHFSADTWNSDKDWLFCKEIAPVHTMRDFITEFMKPSWELEPGVVSGRWIYVIDTRQSKKDLDQCWLQTLMAMINDRFGDYAQYICGCTLHVRPVDAKLSLWMEHAEKNAIKESGILFKELLGIRDIIKYEECTCQPDVIAGQQPFALCV